MFKMHTFMSLFFLFPLMGFWLYRMTALHSEDIALYQRKIQEQEIASSKINSPTNQYRKQVRKDIWLSQLSQERLHYHIASENSLLTLSPVNNKVEILESLQNIRCWMQDKLFYTTEPMQQSRYIEAKEGSYRYATQEFLANNVSLSLFQLPGHVLPLTSFSNEHFSPFLRGVARSVSFFFSEKTPQFQAEYFQTEVTEKR